MQLSSPAFHDHGALAERYGKKHGNISPPLEWREVPAAGTPMLALSMIDTHPVARGYVHWLVIDIDPATTTSFAEGAGSAGLQSGRDVKPYVGPSLPSGTHSYEFTLYALAEPLPILSGKTATTDFFAFAHDHLLASTKLTAMFTKTRHPADLSSAS